MLEQTAWRADQNVRHLAQHRGLNLKVFTAGDQARLDERELRKTLNFLERLLCQLTGRQQNQRFDAHADFCRANQTVQNWQYESGGFTTPGLSCNPQVTPFERERDGRCLHRRRLDKFKLGHSFKQAFVQGEIGKHGCYLEEMQKFSAIG